MFDVLIVVILELVVFVWFKVRVNFYVVFFSNIVIMESYFVNIFVVGRVWNV